jgi:ribosomal protein S18 acetylase RimI-like enzyme
MLKTAREEDAERVARLHLASWRVTYTRELSEAFRDGQDAEAWTANWRAEIASGVQVILAEDEDMLEGFVACGPPRGATSQPDAWEIYNLHTAPGRYGSGVGTSLFAAAAERGRQQGARQLFLWVVKTNFRARAFYEAKGMQLDGGEQDHRVGDETLHEVRYRVDL